MGKAMDNAIQVAPSDPWIRTTSPEQSIHLCKTSFYPHRLRLLGSSRNFGLIQRVTRVGPITVGDITYETDVALGGFDEIRTSYHVNVPLKGGIESRHRGLKITPSPEVASIYRPDSEMAVTRWPAGTRNLAVKIDQFAVDRALESLVEGPVDSPIPFEALLPLNGAAAQSWVRLLLMVQRQLDYPDGVIAHSVVSVPLVESLLHGFLLVADHPYRDALAALSRADRRRCVTRWTSSRPERTCRSPPRH
jgi:AraC-binding-like domain